MCADTLSSSFTHSPLISPWPCFDDDKFITDCKLAAVDCTTQMRYTKMGALVFSKDKVTGLPVDSSEELTLISERNKTNYFVPWSQYKMVQSSLQVMYSGETSDSSEVLIWKTSQNYSAIQKWLDDTAERRDRTDLENLYRMIENRSDLFLADHLRGYLGLPVSRRSFLEYLGFITAACMICFACIWCGKLCYPLIAEFVATRQRVSGQPEIREPEAALFTRVDTDC